MKQHLSTDQDRRPRPPALPRTVRWAIRFLVGLPLIVFAVAAAVYFAALGRLLRTNLAPIAANETGRQIGHEVRLGSIRFAPGALVLNDVAVSKRRTFVGSGMGVTTPRIAISYSLHDLLFDSGNAAHAIGDITIDRPEAFAERYTQKTFNFTDVIDVFTKKPPKPHAKPFAGRIIVRNGLIHARDYTAPANLGTRPANNTLADVNATVDFHSLNNVYFAGTGLGVDGRVTNVGVSGDASRRTGGRFRVAVKVADADAAYWSSYFAQASSVLKKATVVAGRASLDLTASRLGRLPAGLPVDLEGRVTVRQATVALHDPRFQRLPIQGVSGFATFTGSGMTINGSLLAGGQPVRVDGTIFDFTNPQLAFTASSAHLDTVRLAHYFPQLRLPAGLGASPAPVTGQVTGSSLNPVVQIQTVIPAVTYQRNTVTDLRTSVLYANNVFLFPSATFRLQGGGQGALRVTINSVPKIPTVRIGGRVTGVNLAALHLPTAAGGKPLALGGSADIAFLADDQGKPLSVVANVSVDRPRVARTVLRAARGRVAYSPAHGLTLSRAVLTANDGGVATASGTVPVAASSPLDLAVNASGANLAHLLAPYSKADVGGIVYAQAHVSGPLSAPRVSGRVQMYGGRYGRAGTDLITGSISGDADAVRLQGVEIRRYPTAVLVSGTVSGLRSQNPRLALAASLSRGYLSNLVSLADELAPASRGGTAAPKTAVRLPELSGLVSGTARVTGLLKSPQIMAHASVSNLLANQFRIRAASADIAYADGTVRVANAAVRTDDGATATAQGRFTAKTGRIDAAFTAKHIDLDQYDFLLQSYADADGLLDVTGRIGGTLQAPFGAATLTAQALTVEGQTFAPLTVSARYEKGVLAKTGGPLALTLLTPGADGARYIVDTLRVTLPTPAHRAAPASLSLAAQIPESSPENLKHLVDALRASRFRRTPAGQSLLAQVDNLPASPEGKVWVPTLTVSGPISAPKIQAAVGAQGLAVADNKIGLVDARLAFSGGPNPSGRADVTAADIQAAGVPLQSVVAQADYADRVITVSRLDARSAEAYLHGQGRADLDGAVSANVDASNVPLSLFNLFLPAKERLSGQISALTVVASGQTRAPDLTASVDLDQPGVTVTPPPALAGQSPVETRYGIDSVRSSKITLTSPSPGAAARILAVNDLAAFKNGRRIATLSGTLPIALPAVLGGPQTVAAGLLPGVPGDEPLHADLSVADLSVLSLFSPALIDPKRTGGMLSASVDYGGPGGTATAPRLLGQVNVANATLGVIGFDTGLSAVNGRFVVENDKLTVPAFTAKSSKGGTLSLSGGGTLGLTGGAGRADMRLTARDLRVDETGKGNFLAKTYNTGVRGQVNGAVAITGPWQSPLVATIQSAPLVVSDALGTLSIGPTPAATAKTVPTIDPRFNVTVLLGAPGKTISVRGPFLTADVNGDLELTGRVSSPVLKAHTNVARGQFILPPTTRLAIVKPEDGTSNTVDVRYPALVSDPSATSAVALETRVHLVARSSVSVSPSTLAANQSVVGGVTGQAAPQNFSSSLDQSFGHQGSRYTIMATINGLLNSADPNQPKIDLTSDPGGLNRQQMLAALVPEGALQGILGGGQGAETAFKQGLQEAFNAVAVPALLSPFEAGVAGALGLEDFSVEYAPNAPVNVTLSKQIAPRLLVTYIRAIGSRASGAVGNVTLPPQYTLKLGYGLTRRFQLSVSTDDQKNNTLALESIFNF